MTLSEADARRHADDLRRALQSVRAVLASTAAGVHEADHP
jgi:hypothetical protein